MHKKILLAACFSALSLSRAFAAPAEIASVIHADAPYGSGKYTFLFMTAYSASLWTDAPQWSMKAPFALTLTYGMDFSTDDIVSRSLDEMKHVDPALSDEAVATYGTQMTGVFPPVKKGDALTALYQPGEPVQFFLNGKPTGNVAGRKFAADFFGIWLSPKSSAKTLRASLLKLK